MALRETLDQALAASVQHAFQTMLNVDIAVSEIPGDALPDADLICTLGLAGQIEGSLSLALSGASACTIVSKMLQEEISQMTATVSDGIGEVANLVAGGTKMRVSAEGCCFDISIPTIVMGKVMRINTGKDVEKILRHCHGDGFAFDVEFVFKFSTTRDPASVAAGAAQAKAGALERLKTMTAKAKEV